MLERGIHLPTLTSLFALAQALDMKPSDMVRLLELDMEQTRLLEEEE